MKTKNYFNLLGGLKMLSLLAAVSFLISCGDDEDPKEDPKSDAKEILSFVFAELDPAVTATISGTDISATVPFGTDLTALKPTVSIPSTATVNPSSLEVQDFSTALTYTVTAEDGTTKAYTVTVTDEPGSDEKEITSFKFAGLDPVVEGVMDGMNISANVPFGTDLTALVPTIEVSDFATVNPASGAAADFSSAISFTVTAQDGTTAVYEVTVTELPKPGITVTAVWEKTTKAGTRPTWFTANNERDLAMYGDYVYVHNNNDKIRVLSITDGSDVSAGVDGDEANPNKEFINAKQNSAGGTLTLVNVATDVNGVILGSNLRLGNGVNTWSVYKWDNKDASQEVFLSYIPPTGYRLGDNMSVKGDVKGTGYIWAATNNSAPATADVLRFSITDGVANVVPKVITLAGLDKLGNSPSVWAISADENTNFLVAGTDIGGISEFAQDGSLVGKLPASLNAGDNAKLFTHSLDVAYFALGVQKFVAATTSNLILGGDKSGNLSIIDITNGWENITAGDVTYFALTPTVNPDSNGNATGGIDVTVKDGVATVAAMISNFGVALVDVTLADQ